MARKKVQEVEGEAQRGSLLEPLRKVLLASIGAVALAQDEIEDFVNKLIERGEIAEKDGKKLIRDLQERRKKDLKKAETEMDKQVEEVLGRMSIPTKSDIVALSAKITTLTEKVDELTKA
ncbi:MAG: phasin family protein [Chloroflexi bacterium]|nr:phasin family protein [Chloroflexota bacterium]MBU1751303.1 phasin family protein [Chloroflexota bacterium]